MIFLHITLLIKFPFLPTGDLFIKSSVGGSVASASAPKVSMIMLTHRSWTAVRGAFPRDPHIAREKKIKRGFKNGCDKRLLQKNLIFCRRKIRPPCLLTSQTGRREVDNQSNNIYS